MCCQKRLHKGKTLSRSLLDEKRPFLAEGIAASKTLDPKTFLDKYKWYHLTFIKY